MSGDQYSSKQKILDAINRRSFLLRAGIVTSAILLGGCLKRIKPANKSYKNISGAILGPNSKAGHVLRDKIPLPNPTTVREIKYLIIGSGVSGLSAGRWLKKHGETDFEILELENHIGGNSHSGKNSISSYPLGAHYITIANNDDQELIDFLVEASVITHFEKELPFYNEYYLCFDPEERLLINGQWQEGIVPEFGVPSAEKEQIKKFFVLINDLKNRRGKDGKYAFDIPLSKSSKDLLFTQLDQITFQTYLKEKALTSPYLLWYLNYCCKDDYGQKISTVSAWAGLHYFASRRGKAANAEDNAILTWPDGNGWLMRKLGEALEPHIRRNQLCYQLTFTTDNKLMANVLDSRTNLTSSMIADKIILATPQYVNKKLLSGIERSFINYNKFNYSPWFIANITVSQIPQSKGFGLCWDNVAYNTPSVGYVNAGQQNLNLAENKRVLTYYLPLCDSESRVSRLAAYTRTYEQWLDLVVPELEFMHPGITEYIEHVEGWIWGHGMIAPQVNFIHGNDRFNGLKAIDEKVFFAHTDLSGVSIFEEAFHQGIRAAKEMLSS
jgi:hypothetical protein